MEKRFLNFCVGGCFLGYVGLVLTYFNAVELVENVKPKLIVLILITVMLCGGIATTRHPLRLGNKTKKHFLGFCVGSFIPGFLGLVLTLFLPVSGENLAGWIHILLITMLCFGVAGMPTIRIEDD